MPRPLQVSFESPVTVEQVLSAFANESYWMDRISAFGGSVTLDALVTDDDGTVRVATVQDLRHDMLPGMIARVYPSDVMISRRETWRPVGGRRVDGAMNVSVTGAPGSGRGTACLTPFGNGAQLTVKATVEFGVPLIGGRIERYLAGQLAEGICEVQRFTTSWITQHDAGRK
jgi:hypothetical protein